jgi:hypothetical protein
MTAVLSQDCGLTLRYLVSAAAAELRGWLSWNRVWDWNGLIA